MAKSTFTLSDGSPVSTTPPEEQEEEKELEEFSLKAFVDELKEDLASNKITLPTLPNVAMEALLVVNDVDSSASDLVKVIHRDTSITARLIRYANSPLYHGLQPITSIKPAITRIGFDRVKSAIYTVSMKEVFKTAYLPIEQRMKGLWEHSVSVGTFGASLAKTYTNLDPDTALVAGLIHDIGKIPILIKACEHQELINKPAFLDDVLTKLHSKLGGVILKLWKFDPMMIQVVTEHENLNRNPGGAPVDYVDLIQAANIMSYEGTDHALAKIDRDKIASFKRLKPSEEGQEAIKADAEEISKIFR
jgi:putative nucleotidyltransferase with HDIG domain